MIHDIVFLNQASSRSMQNGLPPHKCTASPLMLKSSVIAI